MNADMKPPRKLRLTLDALFPVAQYLGASYTLLSWPRLQAITWLTPRHTGARGWMLLWPLALLLLALWTDASYDKAEAKDLIEIRTGKPYGNMNRSTLLALCVPLLFVLDLLAVVHLHISCLRSGTADLHPMQAGAIAAGLVLFIYGRRLPRIRFGSIWGIATPKTRADEAVWKAVHARASRPVTLIGALCLISGLLLPPVSGLAAAGALCCLAFAAMFLPAR